MTNQPTSFPKKKSRRNFFLAFLGLFLLTKQSKAASFVEALPSASDTNISAAIHGATAKLPVAADADEIPITDSASSFSLKKITLLNLKAYIFGDTRYQGYDFNTVTTPGVYHVNYALSSNIPFAYNGILTVKGYNSVYCIQTYETWTGQVYSRSLSNGTWNLWYLKKTNSNNFNHGDFAGFQNNGKHEIRSNMNDIYWNSIYNTTDTCIGTPLAQWGFVHTMVHGYSTNWRTQMWYAMQSPGLIYHRYMYDSGGGVGVWSAWTQIGGGGGGGGFGSGQSLQDVKASRAFNTPYQNLTGNPITVYFLGTHNTNNYATLYFNGVATCAFSGYGTTVGGTFIVPKGVTYQLTISGETVASWYEFR